MKNSKIIKFILSHKTAVGLGLALSIFSASPTEYKEQYDAKLIEVKALESNIEEIESSTDIADLENEINVLSAKNEELETVVQAKEDELVAAKEAKAEAERIAKEEAERKAREEAERAAKAEADRIAREEAAKNQQASNNSNSSSGGSSNGATEPTTTYVWKTATGSKYHSHNSCGNTNSANATKITIQSAKSAGLTACKKCY